MKNDIPDFMSDTKFENMSPEDSMGTVSAALAFHLYSAVSTEQASLLFRFGCLKMDNVSKPEIRPEPFQYIWFTREGEELAKEIASYFAKDLDVPLAELKAKMSDFIEDEITDYTSFGISRGNKYLMHRHRLEKELVGSWERRKAVAEIYAIWF